jgi:hypothetical protein
MPYLETQVCRKLDIHPGGILEGKFHMTGNAAPHVEDANYEELMFNGACSSKEFKTALKATLFDSMSEGFEHAIEDDNKCIPIGSPPCRSLITLKVKPNQLQIVRDSFNPDKLKAHVTDNSGTKLSFVPITDRGFYDYAINHVAGSGDVADINSFIHSQKTLFLRLGLGRAFAISGRNGYWIQLNGIYTFPKYLKHIRCYD